jgi:hypothetical protein
LNFNLFSFCRHYSGPTKLKAKEVRERPAILCVVCGVKRTETLSVESVIPHQALLPFALEQEKGPAN